MTTQQLPNPLIVSTIIQTGFFGYWMIKEPRFVLDMFKGHDGRLYQWLLWSYLIVWILAIIYIAIAPTVTVVFQ